MNAFDELLEAFQDGRQIEKRDEFFLVVATRDEWEADPRGADRVLDELGFIALPERSHPSAGYLVLAPVVRVRCGEYARQVYRGPFDRFRELAARGGDLLPYSESHLWPARPSDPVNIWLTFLWYERRPAELGIRISDVPPFSIIPSWKHPFAESAEVIIHRKLNTPAGGTTPGEPEVPAETFTVATLREMTTLSSRSLNKYAKSAGVDTPQQGQRNFRYSAGDVLAILKKIIDDATEEKVLEATRKALANLQKATK